MSENRKEKSELRTKVLQERDNFDPDTWKTKSDLIIKKVQDLESFVTADCIHTYLSMDQRNEVATEALVNIILRSEKTLVVPVSNLTEGTLTHSIVYDIQNLKENKWGVREPIKVKEIEISQIDLILVPMAAADRTGNRLGYGKGFYDRFLNKANAMKVGLVFSEFLYDEIPTESFDEKLDIIVTDKEVIYL